MMNQVGIQKALRFIPKGIQKALPFIDSWLSHRLSQEEIPGLSVAIAHNSQLCFARAYGIAEIKSNLPLTTDHRFQVASQTKMLTAALCLQLVEAGQLKLQTPVSTVLPWLSKHPDQRIQDITIEHLLAHRSGLLRDGQHSDYWMFDQPYPSKSQLQQEILQSPIIFLPGSSVKYSNLGYALLGEIISANTGQTYAANIKYVLKQLRLDALISLDNPQSQPVAQGYGLRQQVTRPAMGKRSGSRSFAPAVGLYATPEAMCYMVSNLLPGNTKLLSDVSKHAMQSKQATMTKGYDTGLSFGFGHEFQTVGSRDIIGHGGHAGGHVTGTYFDPQLGIAVSVSANAKDAPSVSIIRGIFGIIDFFLQGSNSSQYDHFNARLYNQISTVQIVSNGTHLAAIDPDSWEPFAWPETLEKVDAATLRVTTLGSTYNFGEPVCYTYTAEGAVASVRFGGLRHFPDNRQEK